MTNIEFTATGQPIPQPRYVKSKRHGGFYVPKTKKGAHPIYAWRLLVQTFGDMVRPQLLMDGPLAVSLRFYLPRPKAHYRTGRFSGVLKDSAPKFPAEHHNDCDNLAKAVLDALNGILWVDDGLINDLHVTKQYGEDRPGVDVTVASALEIG